MCHDLEADTKKKSHVCDLVRRPWFYRWLLSVTEWKGTPIKMGSDLFKILTSTILTPGKQALNGGGCLRNIRSQALSDHKFRSEDDVDVPRSTSGKCCISTWTGRRTTSWIRRRTYKSTSIATFGDLVNYLIADMSIRVEFYGTEPVGIELPQTVDLLVEDTVPGIKGATASAQVKPARLETDLVVQVRPFVNAGDRIRVNTETGEYQSRV